MISNNPVPYRGRPGKLTGSRFYSKDESYGKLFGIRKRIDPRLLRRMLIPEDSGSPTLRTVWWGDFFPAVLFQAALWVPATRFAVAETKTA